MDRYEGLVIGVARAHGLQYADADEVFQRVFLDLHRSLNRLRDPSRVSLWIRTAARRASLRLLQQERQRAELHRRATSEMLHVERAGSADELLETLEERARMREALDVLGEPCRSLLQGLFGNPPRSYRQLSKELGFAVGSLGSTRARCLGKLRRSLARIALRDGGMPLQAGRKRGKT